MRASSSGAPEAEPTKPLPRPDRIIMLSKATSLLAPTFLELREALWCITAVGTATASGYAPPTLASAWPQLTEADASLTSHRSCPILKEIGEAKGMAG